MLVHLLGPEPVALDVPGVVTWQGGMTGEHGAASFAVPRGSTLWDAAIIPPEGGALVEIATHAGTWRGITDAPTFDPAGATVDVLPLSVWLEGRLVAPVRTFRAVPAGAIARAAAYDALGGLGAAGLRPGTFCEGGALIPTYAFAGQSILQVLNELRELSGQSWEITDDGRLSWVPVPGRFIAEALIDDGRLLGTDRQRRLQERAREIVEVDANDIAYRAVAGEVPVLWPFQRRGEGGP